MLAPRSSVHIPLGVCPARTRHDCTRCSARAHHRTIALPEAHPKALSRAAPVSHVTATTIRAPTQRKLPESGRRHMGRHVAAARRLHGHRPHDVLVGLAMSSFGTKITLFYSFMYVL